MILQIIILCLIVGMSVGAYIRFVDYVFDKHGHVDAAILGIPFVLMMVFYFYAFMTIITGTFSTQILAAIFATLKIVGGITLIYFSCKYSYKIVDRLFSGKEDP